MPDFIDIQPGTLGQVKALKDGHAIRVDNDVQNVANLLLELGNFFLTYDPDQDLWIVMQLHDDGNETLVTTAQQLDQRIIHRVREVTSDSYDLAGEIEKSERRYEADRQYALNQHFGDASERLTSALKKDLAHDIRMA